MGWDGEKPEGLDALTQFFARSINASSKEWRFQDLATKRVREALETVGLSE